MRTHLIASVGLIGSFALCLASGCPTQTQNTSADNTSSSPNNSISPNNSSTGGTTYGVKYKAVVPESLSPDLSEFSEGVPPDPTAKSSGRGPGEHSCVLGNGVIIKAHRFLDLGLAMIARKLNADLASSNITDGHLSGTFITPHGPVPYKADFSAFDIDGDGTADGSGDPATAPIALRLWVDPNNDGTFVRFLCALITTPPTPADPATNTPAHSGAGELFIQPGVMAREADANFHLFIKWDHTDPANRFNEAFFSGSIGDNVVVGDAHIRVDLNTLTDSSLQKTLKSIATFTGDQIGASEFDYVARTIQGMGFATVKGKAVGQALSGEFTACVSLAHCSLSATGCDTIDKTGLDFLAAPTGTEANFPADFPATPTF